MTDPKPVGELLRARSEENERSIVECWQRIADLVEQGTVSEPQLRYVYTLEPDEDAHPLVRAVWARQLRWWVQKPQEIGVDIEAFTFRCKCEDTGWLYVGDRMVRPCERCEPGLYRRWQEHWSIPGHSCPECDGRPRRRGRSASPREDDREAEEQAEDAELV